MLESVVEKYLKKKIKALGGECDKFVSPGKKGVPDRICFLPGGRVLIVETKAPGGEPSRIQKVRIKKLVALGFEAVVADSKEKVDELCEKLEEKYGIHPKTLSESRNRKRIRNS